MDRHDFDRLAVEHLTAALRLAVRLTNNAHDAEEIVQEAMLRASKACHGFEARAQFKTWLFRIIVNVFRDSLRKKQLPVDSEIEEPDDGQPSPFQEMQTRELSQVVAGYVSALPARQREVLVLIAYEQLSFTEAAELLNTTEQNIRTTLHLAREKMKHGLRHYLPERKL